MKDVENQIFKEIIQHLVKTENTHTYIEGHTTNDGLTKQKINIIRNPEGMYSMIQYSGQMPIFTVNSMIFDLFVERFETLFNSKNSDYWLDFYTEMQIS